MWAIPTPGALVRDPFTKRPLPLEGAEVPETSFWLRRLRDGDITVHAEASPAATSSRPALRPAPVQE